MWGVLSFRTRKSKKKYNLQKYFERGKKIVLRKRQFEFQIFQENVVLTERREERRLKENKLLSFLLTISFCFKMLLKHLSYLIILLLKYHNAITVICDYDICSFEGITIINKKNCSFEGITITNKRYSTCFGYKSSVLILVG